MKEKNKMTSTARKLNNHFWMKSIGNFLALNIWLAVLAILVYFVWCENRIPDGLEVLHREFAGDHIENWRYIIKTEGDKTLTFFLKEPLDMLKMPAAILLAVEAVMLIGDLFQTRKIRHLLNPLNEIAIKTDQLTNLDSLDKFDQMEHAISALNLAIPDAKLETGDADLQGLEIAINNLLERMRESQRAQTRFVSDASHELRTPISVIQGYVNMLDRWGKEDEQILNESIAAIKNEAEHMKNLIEQLLFLARGDNGRNPLKREVFNLTEMVCDVFEESEMIDPNHVYHFAGSQPVMVNGDVAMMKQSLRILVQNASKYSSSGDTIKLSATVVDGKAAYIVQDEGMGMAASDVSHVFERFYRSDAARNSSEGGTGLGLSIAKWIVDAHHGEIEVLSRPEFGTRFTVKFPLAK